MIHAALRRLPLALLAGALLLSGCGREPVARNVILISLDTVRADHLGVYGHAAPTSPSLDAFAAGGVVFDAAWATSPWTLPSHASLFTGLYPTRHGVRYEKHHLLREIPSAPEILKQAGFRTFGAVNCLFLFHYFGLARGFEVHEPIDEDQSAQGAARKVTDAALAFLHRSRGERVFLFVHYFDAHSDYRSDPSIEEAFGGRPTWVDGTNRQLTASLMGGPAFDDPEEVAALENLYDAGLRQLDDELGRLLGFLTDEGWLDETLVVIVSDHGEEFMEHGRVMHGSTQYEEQLHVPFVMRGPGVPAGVRVAAPVSIVDFLPTALDLAGLEVPPDLDGISLRGSWAAPQADRTIFAEANRGPHIGSRIAVRRGPHKLLMDIATGERALFDLATDPAEQHDRLAEDPARAEALLSDFERFRQSWVDDSIVGDVPSDMRERLRALGYEGQDDSSFNLH